MIEGMVDQEMMDQLTKEGFGKDELTGKEFMNDWCCRRKRCDVKDAFA